MLELMQRTPNELVRAIESLHAQFSSSSGRQFSPQSVQAATAQLGDAIGSLLQRGAEILDRAQSSIGPFLQERSGDIARQLETLSTLAADTRGRLFAQVPAVLEDLRGELARIQGFSSGDAPRQQPSDSSSSARLAAAVQQGLADTVARLEQHLAQPSRAFESARAEFLDTVSRTWRDTAAFVENALRSHTVVLQSAISQADSQLRDFAAALQNATPQERPQILGEAQGMVRQLSADIQHFLEQAGRFVARLLAEPSPGGQPP